MAERVNGVDAARGLAVLGMVLTHVAVAAAGTVPFTVAAGRSAILFGVLAGVSLALATGGPDARVTPRARGRIAVRSALLFALGLGLATVSTGPMVILCTYALLFLLALPALRWRPRALLLTALAWAVVAPAVSFLLRSAFPSDTAGGSVSPGDLTSWAAAGDAAVRLLLTGAYPVLTWVPFVLVGLAIGRLDLRAAAVRIRVAFAGLGAAVAGYGGSRLALDVLGGRAAIRAALAPIAAQTGVPVDQLTAVLEQGALGTTGTITPAFLLVATPHSGTTFEILGSAGVAAMIIAGACALPSRVLVPLSAVGRLAASVYVLHIVAIALLDGLAPGWNGRPSTAFVATAVFAAVILVVALLWRHRRGPVEWVLHTLPEAVVRPRRAAVAA
ncbi:DUF418 domain-containing protein [Pseudonocardia oroxyli]|uniref:Uncharacterized membrane protein YeiB n=1 Tax=Pseudonocardia oroxyli TaxID=366584 RepID=A0A1G7DLV2_PSEOR|nr:DUF418 domain-containing protein [Pseudonocardia oroxyli]SDE52443.1 Uncharacterized membrane protein YeiB [Pseudonocardia oroxyli]